MRNVYLKYFVSKIVNWYESVYSSIENNDLSKLKIIKLHFFICSTNPKLIRKFPFVAMKYGPVNLELLEAINTFSLEPFEINNSTLKLSDHNLRYISCEDEICLEIDKAVELLQKKNSEIIKYPAFDLVELSHMWSSWQYAYEMAQVQGKNKEEINSELLAEEPVKYYAY